MAAARLAAALERSVMVSAEVEGLGQGPLTAAASARVLPKAREKVLPTAQGSANSPRAKARGSVTD